MVVAEEKKKGIPSFLTIGHGRLHSIKEKEFNNETLANKQSHLC